MKDVALRVKFRFRIGPSREARQLMRMYGYKFSTLMSTCMSIPHTNLDYEDLPRMREFVTNKTTVSDLADVIHQYATPALRKMILDVTPIFNEAPRDLKAFILLSSGIRSHHINESLALNRSNTEKAGVAA